MMWIRFNRSITQNFENNVGKQLYELSTIMFLIIWIFEIKVLQISKILKKLKNSSILFIGPDEGPWNRRKKIPTNQIILFKFDYSKLF